jgi:hypothetical protein
MLACGLVYAKAELWCCIGGLSHAKRSRSLVSKFFFKSRTASLLNNNAMIQTDSNEEDTCWHYDRA